jgi:hypothetical protein
LNSRFTMRLEGGDRIEADLFFASRRVVVWSMRKSRAAAATTF